MVEYGKCNIVGAKDEQHPQPSNRNCERASNIQLRKGTADGQKSESCASVFCYEVVAGFREL